jgi:hypothetical protein
MHSRSCFFALAFARLASLAAILCLVAGLFAATGTAAPVPQPKPDAKSPPSHDVIGTWSLTWMGEGGGNSVCTLRREGGWFCQWHGMPWIGHWSLDGDVLTVTEALKPSRPDKMPSWYTWKVTLKSGGKLEGKLKNGGAFKLTPVKKVKPDF